MNSYLTSPTRVFSSPAEMDAWYDTKPMPQEHPRRRGFTLVELLVVIGIIALLISILMPALNKARTHAKTVQCMSNMRQVGQAFAMYVVESKGSLPQQVNGYIDMLDPDSWVYKVVPYTNNNYEVFSCSNADLDTMTVLNHPGMTYIYNGFASGGYLPGNKPAKQVKAKQSSDDIVLADHGPKVEGSWIIANVEGYPYGWYWWYPHPRLSYGDTPYPTTRSVMFADWHVEQSIRNTLPQSALDWPTR
jgi:prepilin-type N-terminal cleavage/methylation domain-containing protein